MTMEPSTIAADRSKMTVSDEMAIEIVGMNKWYGDFHVLRDIDLSVYRGDDRYLSRPAPENRH